MLQIRKHGRSGRRAPDSASVIATSFVESTSGQVTQPREIAETRLVRRQQLDELVGSRVRHGSTSSSRLMSAAGAECVSAPTET